MSQEIYTYKMATHFLSALINGDESGLSDDEAAQLHAFEQSLPRGGVWDVIDDGNNFTRCEVCDLHADCATLTLTII